jgi:predicted dehydrogenase
MSNKKRYKAAIIGCGRIASDFDDDPKMVETFGIASHAGGYTDNDNIDLIAASDISKEKLDKFGKRWDVPRLYSDYTEMLGNEEVDILSICTWNSTHLEILEVASKSNVRAIWCEKPISDSLTNAKRMIEIADAHKIKLAVNHSRRWDKLYINIADIIHSGELGEIQQVSCYYTGGLANTCSHLFDVLRMFLGDAEGVAGWINDSPGKDDPNMDGYIKFKNGATAILQSVVVKSFLIFEFDIYGTEGRLRIEDNGFGLSYWKVKESEKYSGYNELAAESAPLEIPPKTMVKSAVQDIVESIQTSKEPACTGLDGYKALEMICAFQLSSSENNRYVSIPLENKNLMIKSK